MTKINSLSLQGKIVPDSYDWWFRKSLERTGVNFTKELKVFSFKWLWANRKIVDVIHFHFPASFYYDPKSVLKTTVRAIFFNSKLAFARAIGYNTIWTAHCIYPHDVSFKTIHRIQGIIMTNLVKNIVAHCDWAKKEIAKDFFRRNKVFVIPHGKYKFKDMSKKQGDGINFLFFGTIRAYKGVDILLSAFAKAGSEKDKLVIAGSLDFEKDKKKFKEKLLSMKTKNTKFLFKWTSEEELDKLISEADVIVLPFKKLTTSGSFLKAISCGKAVISSDAGCMHDMKKFEKNFGIVYGREEELEKGIMTIREKNLKALGQSSLAFAERFGWDAIGESYYKIYSEDK